MDCYSPWGHKESDTTEQLSLSLHSYSDMTKKEMATHSSILAWRIPWSEEPGRLRSTGSQRVGHDWATSLSLLETKHPGTLCFPLLLDPLFLTFALCFPRLLAYFVALYYPVASWEIETGNWQVMKGCGCELCATLGFVTSGGKEFGRRPEMKLDDLELFV